MAHEVVCANYGVARASLTRFFKQSWWKYVSPANPSQRKYFLTVDCHGSRRIT